MLKTERIHGDWSLEDIFGDGQWCPVCGGEEFTHIEGYGITCDECESEFKLRMTAGDAGVVVDCLPQERGKYIIQRPVLHGKNGPHFYQVLKECEAGLDDRDNWHTNLDLADLGEYRFLTLYRKDGPVGKELFRYDAYGVARKLAHQQWQKRTKAGKEYLERKEAPYPNRDEDPQGYTQYWDDHHRLTCEYHKYEHKRAPVIREKLDRAGHKPGFYLRQQCAVVFDDCYVIHHCIPKVGEEPARPVRY